MPIENGELANLAFVMEAAFLSGVLPDGGITFLRTDLQKMRRLNANSTYRVTHPYGTFLFTTDGAGETTGGGGVAVRLEDGPAVPADWLPPGLKAATITNIGPFLTPADGNFPTRTVGAETHTYIGDGTPIPVTGSPTGNNFFRVERLNALGVTVAGKVWQTSLFALNGRVYTGPIPSDLSFSATYARDASSGQVDIFATALPGAALTISGTGITTTPMVLDNPATGKYFLNIPLTVSNLPTSVTLANSLDLQSTAPHPVTLVDEINITQATYNPETKIVTVKAKSRDKATAPAPTLTATDFTAPNILDADGTLTKNITGTIPPKTVTVTSSLGGSQTVPLSVTDTSPATSATLTVFPSSPQLPGPQVTFTASATGGSGGAYEYEFWLHNGAVWSLVQPYSSSTTLAWPTNSLAAGTYTVAANVRVSGSNTPKDATAYLAYKLTTAASGVTVISNLPSPHPPGTPTTFVAAGAGGSGFYEYRFSLFNGTSWTMVQNHSTNALWTLPGSTPAGNYIIAVDVRNAGSNVIRDAVTYYPYTLSTPATGVSVTSDQPSPHPTGTPVLFTAAGAGGSGTYEYRFFLFDGTTWTKVQDYSGNTSWTLPGSTPAGSYNIAVDVRSAGSTVNRDAVTYYGYVVQ
jgi:hypothetical protein